ncbi:stage II sporulation protein P [Calderihabitans maritimus]|uniref:Ribonucleases G and E n=1 Tax=Calderihabitans maritimus TaxID=1246530 RepID=A0A1Z5HV95_9FIRM|nr:stage II sporulation protein P [Calderihabitans maritimus]GAW93459.1 ribonucleases G and E [Calderihabitans maritimus]
MKEFRWRGRCRIPVRWLFGLKAIILTVIIVFSLLIGIKSSTLAGGWRPVLHTAVFNQENYLKILTSQLPVLTMQEEIESGRTPEDFVEDAVRAVAQVKVNDPKSFLQAQLVLFNTIQGATLTAEASVAEEITVEKEEDKEIAVVETNVPVQLPSNEILVGIYNTHNAETYLPTDGTDRLEGKNGGVVKVAETLQNSLEEIGVRTARSEKIHDYPDWNQSYGNSEETAKKMLREHPSIKVLIDIHRDAGLKEKELVYIEGKPAARILLIVGSDARWDHPTWKKNWQFALKVHRKMEEMFPGLSRGVRVQSGRYNQHLHPRAILVEVGSVKNSLEEAKQAVTFLARVLKAVLEELE